ncbi:MAG: hypothetical protein ACYDHC_02890 [Desulfuromonadaceae bacterium]
MNEIVEELYNRLETDLQIEFDERAGILEYEAGMERTQAEQLALLYLLKKYPAALLPSYMKQNTSQGERHE